MGRAGEPQTRVPPCRGGSISAGPPPADPHGPVPSPRCYQRGPRRPRAALTVFGQALDHLHGRLEPGGVHRAGLRHLPVPSRPRPPASSFSSSSCCCCCCSASLAGPPAAREKGQGGSGPCAATPPPPGGSGTGCPARPGPALPGPAPLPLVGSGRSSARPSLAPTSLPASGAHVTPSPPLAPPRGLQGAHWET